MPVERCLLADLETCVEKIEKKNRVVNVQVVGNAAIVVYETKRAQPGGRETR